SLVSLEGLYYEYDGASRLTWASIGPNHGPESVEYSSYDLGGRPAEEVVGSRSALVRTFDVWGRTTRLELPAGVARSAGDPFIGFDRTFDGLDRLTEISARSHGSQGPLMAKIGATWDWGGRDRLYRVKHKGPQAFTTRFGYIGDNHDSQTLGASPVSLWKLGSVSYGSDLGHYPVQDEDLWGRFVIGRRNEDGAKIGRVVEGGSGLVTGLGWSWGLDKAERLTSAFAGVGSFEEEDATGSFEEFGFGYGGLDQLEWMTQGSSGRVGFTSGEYGRIKTR
ncbi:MAG: hypothetical protein GY867_04475, partial [bacterium]|nr:hypothetical protein [bacterium]